MLITICDKCGSRIEENKGRFIFEMDFCPDCTEKLKQVVQAWIDEPEEEKNEVSEEDFKKITAGTLAGLNIESIKTMPSPNAAPVKAPEEELLDSIDEGKSINRIEIPEEIKEQVKKAQPIKRQKNIDWDKACALKTAGWSNHEIAMELRANEGTINACIYGKLKNYKSGKHYDD